MKKDNLILVTGHFNVLHPGHLRLLRFAKECGGRLIVGVESDKLAGTAAYVPEQLRFEGIKSNSWVDEAFIVTEPVSEVIARLKPDIVVKGKEHELRFNPELSIIKEYGGKLLFSSGETAFSSVDLLRKELSRPDIGSIILPKDYMARHNIETNELTNLLNGFGRLKVCVIGDLIVDEYISCQPLGMSQEDPTIVVTPIDTICFVGGAGIVAAHAAGLGASVNFISVSGNDNSREFALKNLSNSGVHSHILIDENRPTTLKQRYRSKGKSLLRVSYLHQDAISIILQEQIIELVGELVKNTDLLVFSDFNYGCLPQSLVDRITSICKENDVMLAADSQSSSQVGDIGRFKGMNLITPTEHEARISLRNQQDGLVVLAEQLKSKSKAKNILLKMGEEGLLVHADHDTWLTDRISALNSVAIDVSGAGDSLLIASAMTLACKGSIWAAACMGSLAAAVQVSRLGNTPIRTKELTAHII